MRINRVEGYPNYIRDDNTKAIINTDAIEYKNYILAKELKMKEQEKIQNIENEIKEIKDSIKYIMEILKNESK